MLLLHLVAVVSLAPYIDAISPSAIAFNKSAASVQAASTDNGGLVTEGVATLDGLSLDAIAEGRSAEALMSASIPNTNWVATADSYQPGFPPSSVLDGNLNGQSNGNVGEHQILLSVDNSTWTSPAFGTYDDSNSTKTTIFEATYARYVRLIALTEAGNRGPWTSCASFNIFETSAPAPATGEGEWSPTIDFPLVPVSAAIDYSSGNVLVWSSWAASTFAGSVGKNTLTASYNLATGIVSQRNISNTDHDMFCEGLSLDAKGRIVATGGNDADKTSIYDPEANAWTAEGLMKIARGYQSMVSLSNGNLFTIGGSWSGGEGGKNGEIYNPSTNNWTLVPGAPVAPMLLRQTNDAQLVYRADNHAMLFAWKGASVFQAGPSKAMNWYSTIGMGSQVAAGPRAGDGDAMCGNAVMYDATAGKILVIGGSIDYQGANATTNAHIITIGTAMGPVAVQTISSMSYPRIFANAVVLPNGAVFISGGQEYGIPFSDNGSQLQPEMWNPASNTFTKLAPQAIPRNYHSIGILLPDATILSAGGGLCGACATNHYDGQIYSPSYLFNANGSRAIRPVIETAPSQVSVGGTLIATTNSLVTVTSWAMVRISATTHTVNTDQRRVPLNATANGTTYTMHVPTDPGVLVPGYYYLFAMNPVPSLAKFVSVPVP
ncbi:MAG: hypothetical protein ASARMPREDX12_008672 [Alectoria sarmentosa]|nr:MAG: hypothetical protein ASARMPREDX12_008672 [Alectoria sarmentosa]